MVIGVAPASSTPVPTTLTLRKRDNPTDSPIVHCGLIKQIAKNVFGQSVVLTANGWFVDNTFHDLESGLIKVYLDNVPLIKAAASYEDETFVGFRNSLYEVNQKVRLNPIDGIRKREWITGMTFIGPTPYLIINNKRLIGEKQKPIPLDVPVAAITTHPMSGETVALLRNGTIVGFSVVSGKMKQLPCFYNTHFASIAYDVSGKLMTYNGKSGVIQSFEQ